MTGISFAFALCSRQRSRRHQVLIRQSLQHLLVADSTADFLSAPPIKSRLIAINSGHSFLLVLVVDEVEVLLKSPGYLADSPFNTLFAFPALLIAKAQRAVQGVFEVKTTSIRLFCFLQKP
jgi:hypothetical protein